MVAPDTVRRHLDLLAEFTTELQELQREGEESYAARDAYAGRYLVQSAAQTCIDLANHVIASEGWRNPIDYRDALLRCRDRQADLLPGRRVSIFPGVRAVCQKHVRLLAWSELGFGQWIFGRRGLIRK